MCALRALYWYMKEGSNPICTHTPKGQYYFKLKMYENIAFDSPHDIHVHVHCKSCIVYMCM